MKILPKNDLGIQHILTVINQLRDKNNLYLKGTFSWLLYKHPPFPKSYIVYDPERNMYFHRTLPSDFKTTTWEEHTPSVWIKEKTFSYCPNYPFEVMLGPSEWILKLLNERASDDKIDQYVNAWIDAYHEKVEEEREVFKSLLSHNEEKKSLPLF